VETALAEIERQLGKEIRLSDHVAEMTEWVINRCTFNSRQIKDSHSHDPTADAAEDFGAGVVDLYGVSLG
jgi:hypothetical protein